MQLTVALLGVTLLLGQGNSLIIHDFKKGSGPAAKAGDVLTVHYTGKLTNGKTFDTSRQPDRTPFEFTLGAGKVIKGWDQGLVGMKVGGKRKLTIPPSLAYGERNIGDGLIPPNSTLIFYVTVLKINGEPKND